VKSISLVAAALAALVLAYGCSPAERQASLPQDVGRHIKHVVIIVQENRSFDNLFHGYPGADTADFGSSHDGSRVQLQPVSLRAGFDISNGFRDFQRSYDSAKMDGFDLRAIIPRRHGSVPLRAAQYPNYAFVPHDEIAPYLVLASEYVLADRMFQSNIDQSFAAHLYLIAGQAHAAVNVPTGRPWGCDAAPRTRVLTIDSKRRPDKLVFPCFDMPTLADQLNAASLSWAYYAPAVSSSRDWRLARKRHVRPEFGQLWSSYDAIPSKRFGPAWTNNVVSPSSRILSDIRRGRLPNVAWVVPDWRNSDHAFSMSDTGPSWVAGIVNEIGRTSYWNDTAILITWDDSGGWYDHVPPPQIDFDGLGFRVPLIVVSSYAKRSYVSHAQHEFGSILRFTESVFSLHPMAASDARADDLHDCFEFSSPPRPFELIPVNYGPDAYLQQAPSLRPPDDD
jgi:phospholipase C